MNPAMLAMALPFPDGAFDVVLCQHGFQFVPDRAVAVHEMRRVLAPGGRHFLRPYELKWSQPSAGTAVPTSLTFRCLHALRWPPHNCCFGWDAQQAVPTDLIAKRARGRQQSSFSPPEPLNLSVSLFYRQRRDHEIK